jgi:replicative DNA helicase
MSDLERKILARLDNPEAIAEVWDVGVRGELFEEPLFQAVYNFIIEYWQSSQRKAAPTAWVLSQEYPGYAVTDDATEETAYLAELLRRRFTTNQLQAMMRTATDTMHTDPVGTLKALHSAAFSASESVALRVTRTNMADTIEQRRQEYAELENYPQGMGVPYGLDLLDLHTGGLMPGELAVVCARVKTGKTMLGLHAAAKMVRQGYKPIVFTLEMSLKEITQRLDAMFSGVSYNRLLHGQLTIPEMKKLYEAQEELASLGGIQIEKPEEPDRTVAALLARARQYGANWVFIDQLSKMEAGRKVKDLKEHHGTIVKALKNEIGRAGEEIPCLLAAQARRGDEEITLESLSNATEIEAEADIIFGLHRNKHLRSNHMMALDILGARRGDNAQYLLNWELTEATHIAVHEEVH